MPYLLSEVSLLHHSDIDMKSRSRTVQTSSTTDLWWQWHQRCSKLGFHHAPSPLRILYVWCTSPRLTPCHSDHLLGAFACHLHLSEVAQLPFLHSHSAPLTFWEVHLNWGVATVVWKNCSPPSTHTVGCEYLWRNRRVVGWLREFVPSSFALSFHTLKLLQQWLSPWNSTSQLSGERMA